MEKLAFLKLKFNLLAFCRSSFNYLLFLFLG
ncbi:MAG: hypothetical protein MRECE_35c001, partial [Mycoplasmataceae bacterium CE_OT135]